MGAFKVLLHKEFLQIRRNVFLPKLIIVFPFLIMLVMPLIMTMDVKHINVSVVDLDRSGTSRRILSHIGASDYLSLFSTTSEYSLALKELEDGDVDVIVQIPSGFERNLSGESPLRVSIVANAVNATKGSMGMQYLMQTVSRSLSELRGEKSPSGNVELITVQNKFNPTLNYRNYMIPGLMIMLFVLFCGFLPALSVVGEKESGTIEQINVTPVGRLTFTLAKLLPYWLIGFFVLTMSMIVAWVFYGLVPSGSIGAIYLGAALFILTISGLSLTVANFSDTMQQTMFVMFFFVMVFILMSGLMTPIGSMPEWAQKITLFLPPRYFVEILRSAYLKGISLSELWSNYVVLTVFAFIFNLLAALTYRKQK